MSRLMAIVKAISKRAVANSKKKKRKAAAAQPEPPTPFPVFEGVPDVRATKLLLSMLTKAERKQYESTGCVDVIGKSGTRYRLYASGAKVITAPQRGSMCVWVSPDHYVHGGGMPPMADHVLACLLHIKTDEAAFLKVARISWA